MMKLIPISIYFKEKQLLPNALYAESFASRIKGLLGTKNLKAGKGLVIPDCRQVHTFFMNYSIDVIFLDSKNKIIKIQTLSPWKISSWIFQAQKVLEVPAGFAEKNKLKKGDKLEVKEK
jgi:uncharacterized membrane protein (UPF0127 family)